MKDSAISWCHHTFNPWWGCWKISAGCTNCYAATLDKRTGGDHWKRSGERRFMADAYWRGPVAWNKAAAKAGEQHRVFCGSMMDVGETHPNPVIAARQHDARQRLWALIDATPSLDWLLLTKRPAHLHEHLPRRFANVWLGVSVENQAAADERIPELLQTPAAVRFLSCEPLIGPVDLRQWTMREPGLRMIGAPAGLGWIIAGCESGPGARPCDVAWLRSLRDQCAAADVPFFLKQANGRDWVPALEHAATIAATGGYGAGPLRAGPGSKAKAGGIIELPYLDGVQHAAFPGGAA